MELEAGLVDERLSKSLDQIANVFKADAGINEGKLVAVL